MDYSLVQLLFDKMDVPVKIPLNGDEVHVGRNNVLLRDYQKLSKDHAVLQKSEDGTWFIKDLNGRNGLFVNSNRIGTKLKRLSENDIIGFGTNTLQSKDDFVCIFCHEKSFGKTDIPLVPSLVEIINNGIPRQLVDSLIKINSPQISELEPEKVPHAADEKSRADLHYAENHLSPLSCETENQNEKRTKKTQSSQRKCKSTVAKLSYEFSVESEKRDSSSSESPRDQYQKKQIRRKYKRIATKLSSDSSDESEKEDSSKSVSQRAPYQKKTIPRKYKRIVTECSSDSSVENEKEESSRSISQRDQYRKKQSSSKYQKIVTKLNSDSSVESKKDGSLRSVSLASQTLSRKQSPDENHLKKRPKKQVSNSLLGDDCSEFPQSSPYMENSSINLKHPLNKPREPIDGTEYSVTPDPTTNNEGTFQPLSSHMNHNCSALFFINQPKNKDPLTNIPKKRAGKTRSDSFKENCSIKESGTYLNWPFNSKEKGGSRHLTGVRTVKYGSEKDCEVNDELTNSSDSTDNQSPLKEGNCNEDFGRTNESESMDYLHSDTCKEIPEKNHTLDLNLDNMPSKNEGAESVEPIQNFTDCSTTSSSVEHTYGKSKKKHFVINTSESKEFATPYRMTEKTIASCSSVPMSHNHKRTHSTCTVSEAELPTAKNKMPTILDTIREKVAQSPRKALYTDAKPMTHHPQKTQIRNKGNIKRKNPSPVSKQRALPQLKRESLKPQHSSEQMCKISHKSESTQYENQSYVDMKQKNFKNTSNLDGVKLPKKKVPTLKVQSEKFSSQNNSLTVDLPPPSSRK